jgi:hypothetical protein
MSLISDTLSTTSELPSVQGNQIFWKGNILPQTSVVIRYAARVNTPKIGIKLSTSALAVDAYVQRKTWCSVLVPARYYYPLIMK